MFKYPLFYLSQVIPYGVGSLQMRLRRDVERCQCTDKRDKKFEQFCSYLDLQQEWVSLLNLLYLTHIVAAGLFYWCTTLVFFCRDENASVKRSHPRNYKEQYKSRLPQRPRRHNPIQTTWEKWKKLRSNFVIVIIVYYYYLGSKPGHVSEYVSCEWFRHYFYYFGLSWNASISTVTVHEANRSDSVYYLTVSIL